MSDTLQFGTPLNLRPVTMFIRDNPPSVQFSRGSQNLGWEEAIEIAATDGVYILPITAPLALEILRPHFPSLNLFATPINTTPRDTNPPPEAAQ